MQIRIKQLQSKGSLPIRYPIELCYKLYSFSLCDKMTATISWQWMPLPVNRGNCALKFRVIEFVKVIVLPYNVICRFREGVPIYKGSEMLWNWHHSPLSIPLVAAHTPSLTLFPISQDCFQRLILRLGCNIRMNIRCFVRNSVKKASWIVSWLLQPLHCVTFLKALHIQWTAAEQCKQSIDQTPYVLNVRLVFWDSCQMSHNLSKTFLSFVTHTQNPETACQAVWQDFQSLLNSVYRRHTVSE